MSSLEPALTRKNFLRAAIAAAFVAAAARHARADEAVALFRVVSTKDEIVIGVPRGELERMGEGSDMKRIALRLRVAGQFEAWLYASKKAANGDLVMAPLRRVMILQNEALRIEPYETPLKVMGVG